MDAIVEFGKLPIFELTKDILQTDSCADLK